MMSGKYQVVLALACGLAIVCGCAADDPDSTRSASAVGAAGRVRYSYDALGRLVQAAAADGTGVQYSYDAVGNITAIRRLAADALNVVDFAPHAGAIGSTVTVYGSGFDPAVANNAVAFNGTVATVSAATETTLMAIVPDGATSGKIAVSNTRGGATSAADFVVSGVSSVPVIVGFTPPVAAVGTQVTVSGANFQSDARDDNIEIGGQPAQIVADASGPTQTQLKFVVPSVTASGPIALTTPFGRAVSATEFFAVPSSVNAGDVEFTGHLSVGGPALTVTTTTAGKKAVLTFDGATNQGLHLLSQSGSFGSPVTADVYASDGSKLETLTLTNSGIADFTKLLTRNGTYSIVLGPAASDHGTIQLSLAADSALAVDGTTAVTIPAGQNRRFILTTPASTPYGLAIAGLSFTPTGGSLQVALRRSDGAFVNNCVFTTAASCNFPASFFSYTGFYMVVFTTSGSNAASFNAVLSTEITGTIPLDSAATPITTVRPGQNARYSFSGVAGQLVTLILTGNALDDGNPSTNNSTAISVLKPSGLLASTAIATATSSLTLDLELPETGTYTLVIDPSGLDFGTINAQLRSYVAGALAVDGSTAVSLGAGQNARFTFTAQANTGYGLAVTGLTFTPAGGSMQAVLRKPDGGLITNCPFSASGSCTFAPGNFATTGTYLVDFDPGGLNAASFAAVLSTDTTGTLAPDSDPAQITIARPGQNARYSFSGTAGQSVTLIFTGNALDDGNSSTNNSTAISVFKPSGLLASTSIATVTSSLTLDLTLPETGTYTVALDPSGLDSGTINAQLKSYVTGALTINGSTPVSLSAGQNARLTFTAQANTGYGLAVTGLTFTPTGGSLQAMLRKTDGTLLIQCPFIASGSCSFPPNFFPTTGTYLVDFDPSGLNGASFTAVLSTDTTGTVALDSDPTTVTIARPGQNARYGFSGTAGQLVTLVLTGNMLDDGNPSTINSTGLAVFKPSRPNDGPFFSGSITTVTAGEPVDLVLPETGNYALSIDPLGLDLGTINVQIKSYITGTLAPDTSLSLDLSAGRNARFTFAAEAGKGYGLVVPSLAQTPSGGALLNAFVRKLDGTFLAQCMFTSTDSCDLDPQTSRPPATTSSTSIPPA